MKYSQFEALAMLLGAGVVVGGAALVAGTAPAPAEVVAQLLIVFVLGGALHWGRNGGFTAAGIATLVYLFMRLPDLMLEGITGPLLATAALRVGTYAVVGIVGGELCGRTKYVFARLARNPLTEETTGVYNARYAGAAIRSGIARWERYETPYSVIRLAVAPSVTEGFSAPRARHLLRQVASNLRNDIRLVDDLAHLGHGQFLILLPNTGTTGAAMAGDRLRRGVTSMLAVDDGVLHVTALSSEFDAAALLRLASELDPLPPRPGVPAEETIASSASLAERV